MRPPWLLRRDGALHEGESLAAAGTLQRLDAHALVAHDHLIADAHVVHRPCVGPARRALHHDGDVHLDLLDRDPAPANAHLGGLVGGGVEVVRQHAGLRDRRGPRVALGDGQRAEAL